MSTTQNIELLEFQEFIS